MDICTTNGVFKYIDNTKAKDSACQPGNVRGAPIGTAGQSIIERIFIMIYDEIADTLLRAGIPVNTKGFIYTML